ncbi:MauE/DoxX family redox-associated membrane protein [Gelidibacter salicanalis]|uniref:Methylamine utilisation protein MauE domain-containing protein n=1 Tax=Gelidibacter salicanalis TaxID=291193 RepID=A0A934KYG4_9FLAO|nr:MauE/DoxX family redox-associated membrane protein [Gelidibacter salicanalis]MBJ7881620.1 hypothetical protein [Gelidibacter salicanalis]
MKVPRSFLKNIPPVVSLLFVLLFVYAAVSKFLDFQNFQMQIGQSPLLSAFTGFVSYSVLLLETLTVFLLSIAATRRLGLYLAMALMVLFSLYIFIILNYSPFVPCSCGGVLERMSWSEHLLFNILFVVLAMIALYMSTKRYKRTTVWMLCIILVCSLTMALLFRASETMAHERNNFIRRFPQHRATLENSRDLGLNSYKVAGIDSTHIYLTNTTGPLHIKVLDHALDIQRETTIALLDGDMLFRSPKVRVVAPYFYFMDGNIPIILKGGITDWKVKAQERVQGYFSKIVPTVHNEFVMVARESGTNENVLGLMKTGDTPDLALSRELLVKQVDGVFDTDGMLLYNRQLDWIIYTYFYRNQFIVADRGLKLDYRGKTIDTISRAVLEVSNTGSGKVRKIAAPPMVVNRNTATYGNHLFVQSKVMGLYEPESSWKRNSVIDIYDLTNGSYVFSFYVPNVSGESLSEFYVQGNRLVGLIGNHIRAYKLDLEMDR